MSNKNYEFEFEGFKCIAKFSEDDGFGSTSIHVPEKRMVLLLKYFKRFNPKQGLKTEVGMMKPEKLGDPIKSVYVEKVRDMIWIGCIKITQEQYKKFYNLLIFKENEYRKSLRS